MAARYTVEMVLQMLDDGAAVTGLDSDSEISDDEDPDYCPGGSGSRPPGNPTEQDQSDSEDSSPYLRHSNKKRCLPLFQPVQRSLQVLEPPCFSL